MPIKMRYREEERLFSKQVRYYLTAIHVGEIKNLKKIHKDGDFIYVNEKGPRMITDFPLARGDILHFEDGIKIDNILKKSSVVRWAKEIGKCRYEAGLEFFN
jgi:signal peptidase I